MDGSRDASALKELGEAEYEVVGHEPRHDLCLKVVKISPEKVLHLVHTPNGGLLHEKSHHGIGHDKDFELEMEEKD